MENYPVLVSHQHFVCFSKSPELVEFEAIRNGISSFLLVIALVLRRVRKHKEVENVLFRRQEKKMLNGRGRTE